MRKRGRIILLCAAVLAVLGLTVWLLSPSGPPDPVYGGRRLSEWISDPDPRVTVLSVPLPPYIHSNVSSPVPPSLDSNAIPYLVCSLSAHDGLGRRAYLNLYFHFSAGLQKRLGPPPVSAAYRQRYSGMLLGSMGAIARPAIPELIRMLSPADKRRCQQSAMYALSMMAGQDHAAVIDALRAATKANDPDIRVGAEMALQRLEPALVL